MDEDEIRKSAALENRHWWYAGRRALVRQLLRGEPTGRALDVGAGSGGNASVLRDLGWDVSALEYSPAAAGLARLRGLAVVRADARRLPFADEAFDLVMSTDMWEHIREDDQVAAETFRVLKPGGQILIAVPQDMRLWSGHDIALGHVRRYERDELLRLIEESGFEITSVQSWNVLLRPVAWLRRRSKNQPESEMDEVHPVINFGLRTIVRIESTLPVGRWPGISLVVRARKPLA